MKKDKLKIVFFGPPTSGKGTQAKIIAKKLELTHFSTGTYFRQEAENKTELGLQIADNLDKGILIDDEITNKVVREEISEIEGGFILDGYPRTVKQAQSLDKFADITHAFFIKISDDEVVERVSSRRVCRGCGKIYNLAYQNLNDPEVCEKCGGKLYQRSDDKEDVVEKRLDQYHDLTEPIIDFYQDEGVLFEIDGEQSIGDVTQDILEKINLD